MSLDGERSHKEWKQLAENLLETIENLPVGAVCVDGERLCMNRATEEIIGYSRDELQTVDAWFQALYRERAQEIRAFYEARLAKNFPGTARVVLTRKDGEERRVEFAAHRFDDRVIWILQDVTEQEEVEKALRDEIEQKRSILDAAVDAIITTDAEGVIVEANQSASRLFEYKGSEILGRRFNDLMPSPYRREYGEQLARLRHTGDTDLTRSVKEIRGKRKNDSTFPADLTVGITNESGLVTNIVRDITKRRQIEEGLQLEHDFNERLSEILPVIELVLDCDGRVIRFNPVFERISGWSMDEAQDRNWFDTFLPERDRESIRRLFHQAVEEPPVIGTINPILTKSGEEVEIEWFSTVLHDVDGSVVGLLCSGIDVTERLRLENLVYKASEEERIRIAQDLHDGLCSQLSGVAFLSASLSERLRRGNTIEPEDTDGIVKNLQVAISQTRELAHGLNGIGDRPDALPIALKKMAEQARATSQIRCRFQSPGDEFELADTVTANHLYRIAQEAVSNALRHSGGNHLTVSLVKETDQLWRLRITDNGKGFDPGGTSSDGIGLSTMRFRARAIGAKLLIQRRRSQGMRVDCHFTAVTT